jgi:hypothetical protein
VGPHQINFGSPHNLLGAHQAHSAPATSNIIEEFGNLSGLKLNKIKTEGIWLGRLKHTKDKYESITH